jgi:hypothetical protein
VRSLRKAPIPLWLQLFEWISSRTTGIRSEWFLEIGFKPRLLTPSLVQMIREFSARSGQSFG